MTRHRLWQQLASQLPGTHATDDARRIVCAVSACDHAQFLTFADAPVSRFACHRAQRMARRRVQGVPMAYILHARSFFRRDFFVNHHVLIPRPETELLVETALALPPHDLLVDVGTGSGVVGITLALEQSSPVIATDVSRYALRVAKKNAHRFGARVEFFRANLLHHDGVAKAIAYASSILVVANLPYLTPTLMADSPHEVTDYEPHLALIADNNDGLSFYRQLFKQLATYSLRRTACDVRHTILCEIDPRQANAARALAQAHFPSASVSVKKDLSGHARMVHIDIPSMQ